MAPSIVLLVLLWLIPWPTYWGYTRTTLGKKWPFTYLPPLRKKLSANYGPGVVIINAICCFGFVVLYFYVSALPRYNTPKWEVNVKYSAGLALPAFAFIGGYNDPAMAVFPGGPTNCSFPIWAPNFANDCPHEVFPNETTDIHTISGVYGDLQAYVFDPNKLQSGKDLAVTQSDRLVLQVRVSCEFRITNSKLRS